MTKRFVKIIKRNVEPKSTFGTNPSDPWSTKAGLAEGTLEQYLSAKGINPQFVSTQTKIAHAKSAAFLKWKQDHMHEEIANEDMTKGRDSGDARSKNAHSPTIQRQHELEKATKHYTIKPVHTHKKELNQNSALTPESVESFGEAKKPKLTSLDRFRNAATERAKKHAEIEKKQSKDGSGMSSAIDRLEKHLNKEEVLDEVNYDTVKSLYTKRRAMRDEPSKKSKEVKVKNVSTSISRLSGYKTTQKQPFDKVDKGTHFELVPKKEEVSQAKVTKFHAKLDKLVHSTFGKRKNEQVNEANITHAAHFDDPKTGKWASMALLTAKNDEDAVAQAHDLLRTDAYRNFKLSAVEKHEPIKNIKMKEEVDLEEGIVDKIRGLNYGRLANRSMMKSVNSTAKTGSDEWNNETSKTSQRVAKAKELGNKRPFKEEDEQIDELKKSTVKSWLGQQEVIPPKKPGMDRKAHNQRIKTRSKSWDSALDRLTGRKPTSEDTFADNKAATQTVNSPGEGISERKKQMSKSARMIKAIYKKHRMVKEDLYDHEKEDKSVATYGKKPKFEKADKEDEMGEKKPQAAAVMSGGTTLTGQKRDDVEIDPAMRVRPGQPDPYKKDDKKDGKKEDKKKDK
jgi:hypothetical protein